ncbi:thrombospondin type 3 repeat-containing protein [bacterium]|nr:thrombospondin type 3 repeat-containing protein [bacterium]
MAFNDSDTRVSLEKDGYTQLRWTKSGSQFGYFIGDVELQDFQLSGSFFGSSVSSLTLFSDRILFVKPVVEDTDSDGDSVPDTADNCKNDYNPLQDDLDGDGIGNACDDDIDGDGVKNSADNCVFVPNPKPAFGSQTDTDGDGIGDACDDDLDGDEVPNAVDNCPNMPNDQTDTDGDGAGDLCDACPNDPYKVTDSGICGCGVAELDSDGDTVLDCIDNCPDIPNTTQLDSDGDGYGDSCDAAPYDNSEH